MVRPALVPFSAVAAWARCVASTLSHRIHLCSQDHRHHPPETGAMLYLVGAPGVSTLWSDPSAASRVDQAARFEQQNTATTAGEVPCHMPTKCTELPPFHPPPDLRGPGAQFSHMGPGSAVLRSASARLVPDTASHAIPGHHQAPTAANSGAPGPLFINCGTAQQLAPQLRAPLPSAPPDQSSSVTLSWPIGSVMNGSGAPIVLQEVHQHQPAVYPVQPATIAEESFRSTNHEVSVGWQDDIAARRHPHLPPDQLLQHSQHLDMLPAMHPARSMPELVYHPAAIPSSTPAVLGPDGLGMPRESLLRQHPASEPVFQAPQQTVLILAAPPPSQPMQLPVGQYALGNLSGPAQLYDSSHVSVLGAQHGGATPVAPQLPGFPGSAPALQLPHYFQDAERTLVMPSVAAQQEAARGGPPLSVLDSALADHPPVITAPPDIPQVRWTVVPSRSAQSAGVPGPGERPAAFRPVRQPRWPVGEAPAGGSHPPRTDWRRSRPEGIRRATAGFPGREARLLELQIGARAGDEKAVHGRRAPPRRMDKASASHSAAPSQRPAQAAGSQKQRKQLASTAAREEQGARAGGASAAAVEHRAASGGQTCAAKPQEASAVGASGPNGAAGEKAVADASECSAGASDAPALEAADGACQSGGGLPRRRSQPLSSASLSPHSRSRTSSASRSTSPESAAQQGHASAQTLGADLSPQRHESSSATASDGCPSVPYARSHSTPSPSRAAPTELESEEIESGEIVETSSDPGACHQAPNALRELV
jgi:hypothetical protein